MGNRKGSKSKVVIQNVENTNFDVRMIFKHKGEGRLRKVESSSYAIFRSKHQVKDGFNKPELAVAFIEENFDKYDKKTKKFK